MIDSRSDVKSFVPGIVSDRSGAGVPVAGATEVSGAGGDAGSPVSGRGTNPLHETSRVSASRPATTVNVDCHTILLVLTLIIFHLGSWELRTNLAWTYMTTSFAVVT